MTLAHDRIAKSFFGDDSEVGITDTFFGPILSMVLLTQWRARVLLLACLEMPFWHESVVWITDAKRLSWPLDSAA